VAGADIVYTDVWTSMGLEGEARQRVRDMRPFTVTEKLFGAAKPDALFMHCLPAHPGEEVEQAGARQSTLNHLRPGGKPVARAEGDSLHAGQVALSASGVVCGLGQWALLPHKESPSQSEATRSTSQAGRDTRCGAFSQRKPRVFPVVGVAYTGRPARAIRFEEHRRVLCFRAIGPHECQACVVHQRARSRGRKHHGVGGQVVARPERGNGVLSFVCVQYNTFRAARVYEPAEQRRDQDHRGCNRPNREPPATVAALPRFTHRCRREAPTRALPALPHEPKRMLYQWSHVPP